MELVLDWITSGILISLLLIVWAQVASRYIFNNSLPWTEEAARYLMIWGVLLGVNLAYLRGYLISINFFTDKLPPRILKPLGVFRKILSLCFTGILVFYGFRLCILGIGMESPAIGISYLWVFLSVPIGSALLFFLLLVNPDKK